MTKNTPFKQKKCKNKFVFKPKYLIIFFAICIASLVILAMIIRDTQQQLMRISNKNTQQIQTLSLQLQNLQQQQNQYQQWWKNERSNKVQNKLYDALYKIKLANLYFKLGENLQARQLLIDTKPLLSTINTAQSETLKQAIETTIDQLNTLTQVNINKTILALDQINQTIEALPVLNQHYLPQESPSAIEKSSPKTTLAPHWWQPILNQLKQLVIIHRANENEGVFLKENVLLIKQMVTQKILQMQQALLRNDFELYQHNTDLVVTWLKEYFSSDKKQLQIVIEKLQGFRAYTITLKPQFIDFPKLITTATKTIQSLNVDVKVQENQSKKLPTTSFIQPSKPSIEV